MRYIKEILKNIKHKNTTNADNATSVETTKNNDSSVGASIAHPHFNEMTRKTILITLPILMLLIAALVALSITNAAGNTATPETEQTLTEEGDGYYIWVRAVDHAGNKRPLERSAKSLDRDWITKNNYKNK